MLATDSRWAPSTPFEAILGESSHQSQGSLRRPFFVRWYEQAIVTRNFVAAFWRTVVLGCAKPENWEYCFPLDRWLVPAMQDLLDFYTVEPYSKEKELLRAKDH